MANRKNTRRANRKNTRRANRKNTRRANRKNTRRTNRRGMYGGLGIMPVPRCSSFVQQDCPAGGKHNRDGFVKSMIPRSYCTKCNQYCETD